MKDKIKYIHVAGQLAPKRKQLFLLVYLYFPGKTRGVTTYWKTSRYTLICNEKDTDSSL